MEIEICSDCGIQLPVAAGARHPYIGGSSACWTLYTTTFMGGSPLVTQTRYGASLHDAYCVQHHGLAEKAAAVQSVGMHLVALYAVFRKNQKSNMWVIQRMLRGDRRNRFTWLTPPATNKQVTIGSILDGDDFAEQTRLMEKYITTTADNWLALYEDQVADWYERYVLAEKLR